MATAKPQPTAKVTPTKRTKTDKAESMLVVTPSQSYLHNLIPDPDVAKRYVSRYVEGVLDLDILTLAQKMHQNVLIAGDTGSGKTMLVRAYAATTQQPFVNMAGEGSAQPEDFFGGPAIDTLTGGLRWLDGPTLMVVQHGGVLNMDEVNFFKGKVTAATHGLLDERGVLTLNKHPYHWMSSRTGKYFITKEEATDLGDVADIPVTGAAYIRRATNLLVVATYNPDYVDTAPLNEAFRNRFARQLVWDYDPDVEAELIESKTLLEMARKLRDSKKLGTVLTPVSTNLLMTFEQDCVTDGLTFSFAVANFLNHFNAEERSAVEETLKAYRPKLMAEYGWTSV